MGQWLWAGPGGCSSLGCESTKPCSGCAVQAQGLVTQSRPILRVQYTVSTILAYIFTYEYIILFVSPRKDSRHPLLVTWPLPRPRLPTRRPQRPPLGACQ